jgi:hypothetical protein
MAQIIRTPEQPAGEYDYAQWANAEEKVGAIVTNSVLVLQWHPHTLVGFCPIAASSLTAIVEAAIAQQNRMMHKAPNGQ